MKQLVIGHKEWLACDQTVAVFNRMKEKYIQELKNHSLSDPYSQAMTKLEQVLKRQAWESFQKLECVESEFTYARYRAMAETWLETGHLVWFFAGNLDHPEAVAIQRACE